MDTSLHLPQLSLLPDDPSLPLVPLRAAGRWLSRTQQSPSNYIFSQSSGRCLSPIGDTPGTDITVEGATATTE